MMEEEVKETELVNRGGNENEIGWETTINMDRADGEEVFPSPLRQSRSFIGSPSGFRRSGSSTRLVQGSNGSLKLERVKSPARNDMMIAVQRKVSGVSTLLSIVPLHENQAEQPVSAEDLLERMGGKGAAGAYCEHMIPTETLAQLYDTHVDPDDPSRSRGLTCEKAKELLQEFGPNVLTPPARVPHWLLFLLQFTNLLMVLLLITAALCLILYLVDMSDLDNLYLFVILLAVVVFTCYQTYALEAKSDELMERFREMVPEKATVIRDGVARKVSVTDIVIGDILRLGLGDKVPADCRVIYNQSMKVDQSMITGESEPVESIVLAADPDALEARNLIFNGSLVVSGGCLAMAVRTGDATLVGTMVEMTREVRRGPTPLKRDIEHFVRVLAFFALAQAVTVFIVSMARGLNPVDVFVQSFVVIMISNVNQGIPSTVTASLLIVAEQMGKQSVFVKSLDIIEALGSCTLICTDKTGTLTTNAMTVANVWTFYTARTSAEFREEYRSAPEDGQLEALMEAAALNSRVFLQQQEVEGSDEVEPSGDATELGIYRYVASCIQRRTGSGIETFRGANPKVHEVPFNPSCKWQMSVHAMAEKGWKTAPDGTGGDSGDDGDNGNGMLDGRGRKLVMFVKGAPDVLLDKCSHYLSHEGEVDEIDESFRVLYTAAHEHFADQGQRVIAFAMRMLEESADVDVDELRHTLVVDGLVVIGLVSLQEPTRQEVPQAILDCEAAGVKVVLTSGDDPVTAAAIARKIGLITLPTRGQLARERAIPAEEVPEDDIKAVVVHGASITSMSEDDWRVLVSKEQIVFARTTPEQKLTIVKEFTKAGHVVAMTGDGVNDAPALKQAAIGIAMGLNGSDVAREAAEIVLMDDDFASIVVGIRVGRLLFANLKKSIAYSSASIMPEVIPVLLWGFVGVPQPMGALLVLGINLLSDLAPTTSLAYEKPETHLMQVPPRNIKRDKLTSLPLLLYSYVFVGLTTTGGCLLVYFRIFASYGLSARDVYLINNQYFPALHSGDVYHTKDGSGRAYSPAEQEHIMKVARASWFLMIVCGQAAHVWVCRTTTVSIFEHGVFTNRLTNMAVPLALGLGCFVIYTPGLRDIVHADDPPQLEILYASVMVGVLLWAMSEARKWFSRHAPQSWVNRHILAW